MEIAEIRITCLLSRALKEKIMLPTNRQHVTVLGEQE
jgi:hypothetical protein